MEVTTYSTVDTQGAGRFDEWNRVIADTYFPLQLIAREPATFFGQLERRRMGQVSLSRLATGAMQYERQPHHIARHFTQEEYLVTIPLRGPVDFRQLGRDVRCGPGSFILERGDEPYRFSYSAANEVRVLKVPKPALAEKLRHPDRFCARVIDARAGLPALLTSMIAEIQSLAMAETHAANILGRQIVEILALALDERIDRDDSGASSVRAGHLCRAERVVRQNLSNAALSPEFVASQCGISKRYLHELFSDTSTTVAQFIRDERLFAARDAIASSPGLSMAQIAYRFGFSDQAQFSRLFKAQFAMTPTEWRRTAAAGD